MPVTAPSPYSAPLAKFPLDVLTESVRAFEFKFEWPGCEAEKNRCDRRTAGRAHELRLTVAREPARNEARRAVDMFAGVEMVVWRLRRSRRR